MIGVPMGRLMSSVGEIPSTSTSVFSAEGVPPPLVGAPKKNIPNTLLTLASQVIQSPASTNIVGTSRGVVTGIPSVASTSTSFAHTAQSGPIGSSSFVHGFPWNGGTFPHPLHM